MSIFCFVLGGSWGDQGVEILKTNLEGDRVVVIEVSEGRRGRRSSSSSSIPSQVLLFPPNGKEEEEDEEERRCMSEAEMVDILDNEESISELLVSHGLGRVSEKREMEVERYLKRIDDEIRGEEDSEEEDVVGAIWRAFDAIKAVEKKTHKKHKGMWEYGDAGYVTDEEEES